MNAPLCIVVKGFPRISETFITRELEALQDAGVVFSLASLRQPARDTPGVVHRVAASLNYLPEYLHEEPGRIWRSIGTARSFPGFRNAWRMFLLDLKRDFTRNRARRFGQACVLAAELAEGTRHLHAHFIHTPASVARYAAAIRDVSFSVSAHAKDIWTTPEWDLSEKIDQALFVSTCNEAGAERLRALSKEHTPRFWPHLTQRLDRNGIRANRVGPIRFLTVARAVPKKGLRTLLESLATQVPNKKWAWTHIGGGELLETLRADARTHPYRERINILGAKPHAEVLAALQEHDVFVLPAQIADDGDRDGRPNALIEAMSAGLACISTAIGGIPELLSGGAGILVEPGPKALANVIGDILDRPEKIGSLGEAARSRAGQLATEGERAFAELERALRKASGQ